MGLFGKLFDKKECSICGKEIGLLGNRKLEDGNMCKECAAKLSPWFSDRRSSTVAEIEEQLAYRDENKKAVEAFNKKFGSSEAIFGIHEATNRVTIKIVDKDTKEVIKELPPEKTLDMIAKVWEMAGILVDEKR